MFATFSVNVDGFFFSLWSSSNIVDGEKYSEFWNRSGDKSCDSEEEISDSDGISLSDLSV